MQTRSQHLDSLESDEKKKCTHIFTQAYINTTFNPIVSYYYFFGGV